MTTTYIITGPASVVADVRDNYIGSHVVVDVDVSDLPDPTERCGYLEGTDPRVFPAMVEQDAAVVDKVTEIVSAVRGVVEDNPEDTFVFVSDSGHGDVVAPAVGDVVAGFLRHIGLDTDVSHTGGVGVI